MFLRLHNKTRYVRDQRGKMDSGTPAAFDTAYRDRIRSVEKPAKYRAEHLKRSGLSLERVRHRFRKRFACVEPLRGYTKAIQ